MSNTPETSGAKELTPAENAKMASYRFDALGVVAVVWATGLLVSGNPFGAMTIGTMGLMSEIMAVECSRASKKLSPNSH